MGRRAAGILRVGDREAGWIRDGVLRARPLVLLAHGAGAPAESPFLSLVARGLVDRGFCVARFHFPYMERRVRGGTRSPPDRAPVLLDTWRAMLDRALAWRGAGPVVLGGKSLGGRMASMLLAAGRAPEARAVFYLGYPLHPPGNPDRLRSEHLPSVPVPQLFVQGSRDPLCHLERLAPVLRRIGPSAKLVTVEGGDHGLGVGRKDPWRDAGAWLDEVAGFVRQAVTPGG